MAEHSEAKNYYSYREEAELLAEERDYLKLRKDKEYSERKIGLALSGGGIRSASFALGFLQAMAKYNLLKRVDYLSTVSGGGYIGSSLGWLLHKKWRLKKDTEGAAEGMPQPEFGVGPDNFPFGTQPNQRSNETGPGSREKMSLLRHLRQNVNYLFPGGCLGIAALLSALLRGIFLNTIVYGPVLVFLMMLLAMLGTFGIHQFGLVMVWLITPFETLTANKGVIIQMGDLISFIYLAIAAFGLSIILSIVYGLAATFARFKPAFLYNLHHKYFCVMRILLLLTLIALIMASLPFTVNALAGLKVEGGLGVTLGGILSGVWSYVRTSSIKEPTIKIPTGVIVSVAAFLLIYGVLILAYIAADRLLTHSNVLVDKLSTVPYSFSLLLVPFLFGLLININYVTLHGYYRDRLMELFMPDVERLCEDFNDHRANAANLTPIQAICDYENEAVGPYHIINTNILLPGSKIPKFKGRGGDNFILSPRFCGSAATGWQPSKNFIKGKMTYSSAMAISGAAVNPNTGSNGVGPTRNSLLSLVMALLNLRLGVWVENPCLKLSLRNLPALLFQPNLWIPALYDSFIPLALSEKSGYVELSDGGHFENLAVYELIRRETDVIFVSDGAADKDFKFSDLSNLIEKVRLDFGAMIWIDIDPMVPKFTKDTYAGLSKFAKQGYSIGEIIYRSGKIGTLVYLKSTITRNLPADVYAYRLNHQAFPDEPTSDQVFDEIQFEAYRELGYQLGKTMIHELPDPLRKKLDGIT